MKYRTQALAYPYFVVALILFALQVTVSDGKGGSAQATVDVAGANVPALNNAPAVDAAITVRICPSARNH